MCFGNPVPKPWSPTQAPDRHTAGGKFQGQHTALMKVQLVFLWLADVQDLNITALHANGQPVLVGAVAQGKNLGGKREGVGSKPLGTVGDAQKKGWGRGKAQCSPTEAPAWSAAGPGPSSSRQLHVKSLILISITRNPGASHPLSALNAQQLREGGWEGVVGEARRGQSLPLSRWWKGS